VILHWFTGIFHACIVLRCFRTLVFICLERQSTFCSAPLKKQEKQHLACTVTKNRAWRPVLHVIGPNFWVFCAEQCALRVFFLIAWSKTCSFFDRQLPKKERDSHLPPRTKKEMRNSSNMLQTSIPTSRQEPRKKRERATHCVLKQIHHVKSDHIRKEVLARSGFFLPVCHHFTSDRLTNRLCASPESFLVDSKKATHGLKNHAATQKTRALARVTFCCHHAADVSVF